MLNSFTPILVVAAVPYDGGIRFLHYDSQLDIEPEISEKVWKIVEHSNGYNDLETIAKLAALPVEDVCEIVSELVELGVVVDSREQYIHFHKIRNYPAPFNCDLTQDQIDEYTHSPRKMVKDGEVLEYMRDYETFFSEILERRRSCRGFSSAKLTLDQIGNICHYAYSIQDHAVPSGGALYPLKIFILVEREQERMEAGYYEYDAEKDYLVRFKREIDEEQLKYCFNQEEMPFGSSVQIVIVADLKRQPFKYSNRGYTLTMVEVGHVAENIGLYCAEQGIGACELGGVQDEPLRRELELEEFVYPIISVAIGYEAEDNREFVDKMRYVEKHVGGENSVKCFWAQSFGDDGSFFGATAVYEDALGNVQYAGATSVSYADAVFKAVIEGYERRLSSQICVDFHGKARDLSDWVNPYEFFPLTEEQAKKCGVKAFSEDLVLDWTLGRKCDGAEVFIPADIVYYGHESGGNKVYFGHSSGIAAHFDFAEAQKRALVELIERDALMRGWYLHESPGIIDRVILPIHARRSIKYWEGQGRRVMFLRLPSEYGLVVETIIVSSEYPSFVCGAAATIDADMIDNAIYKSLQEAEYNLLLCKKFPNDVEINLTEVLTPADHGKVYHIERYVQTLEWLWSGRIVSDFGFTDSVDVEELLVDLDAITVDMSKNNCELKVVRVLSSKLVPINFGLNSAHYTHRELNGKVHPDSLRMPHYFA